MPVCVCVSVNSFPANNKCYMDMNIHIYIPNKLKLCDWHALKPTRQPPLTARVSLESQVLLSLFCSLRASEVNQDSCPMGFMMSPRESALIISRRLALTPRLSRASLLLSTLSSLNVLFPLF